MTAPATVNPLVVQRQDSTQWYTGLGLVESVEDTAHGIESGSWIEGGLGVVGAGLDTLSLVMDPLGAVVSWGVSWLMEHLKPLSDALDALAGDPDQIAANAQTWKNVAGAVHAAAQELQDAIARDIAEWSGSAADAYRANASAQLEALDVISRASGAIGTGVEISGTLVGVVRGIVRDLIAECIATLAVRLPEWLAEVGLTLGIGTPWVVGQVASLVAKWVNRISGFLDALIKSFKKLSPLLTKLDEIIAALKKALHRLGGGGSPHAPHDPLAPKPHGSYEFNMVENPGPLASRPGNPAANFAGGRYDEVVLPNDVTLYRGGDSHGSPLGQWFTTEPPASAAQVRIDSAVRPQWIDPRTGALTGTSPVDTVYSVNIPAGTRVYPGPVANQGGIFVGGGHQIFVPEPWKNPGVTVVGSEPLP